jgi:hypothetical protein
MEARNPLDSLIASRETDRVIGRALLEALRDDHQLETDVERIGCRLALLLIATALSERIPWTCRADEVAYNAVWEAMKITPPDGYRSLFAERGR